MQVDYHTTITLKPETWIVTQQRNNSVSLYLSEGNQHFTLDFLTKHLPVLEELVKQLKQLKQLEVKQLRQQLNEQMSELEAQSDLDVAPCERNGNLTPISINEFSRITPF